MNTRFLICVIFLFLLGLYFIVDNQCVSGLSNDEAIAVIWEQANDEFNNGNYELVISYCQQIIKDYPEHSYVPKALFLQGDSYHKLKRYAEGKECFEIIKKNYTSAECLPGAYLKTAYYNFLNLEGLDEESRKVIYDKAIITLYPTNDIIVDNFSNSNSYLNWQETFSPPLLTENSSAPNGDSAVLISSAEPGGWECIVGGDNNWGDYRFDATIYFNYSGTGNFRWHGVCGRVNQCSKELRQFYLFVWDGSDGQLRLERYNGSYDKGSVVLGLKESEIKSSGWHKMSIEVVGNKIECYLDDVKVFDIEDNTFSKGKIGLYQRVVLKKGLLRNVDKEVAINGFKEVVSKFPDTSEAAEASLRLGYCYYGLRRETGQPEYRQMSMQEFEKVINHPKATDVIRADARLKLAANYFEYARDGVFSYDEVIQKMDVLINSEELPRWVKARAKLMKAEVYEILKDEENALILYSEIIDNYFDFRQDAAAALFSKAHILDINLAQYEEAIPLYERLLENFTNVDNITSFDNLISQTLYSLGCCKERAGDLEGAKASFLKLIKECSGTICEPYAKTRLEELNK